MRSSLSGLLRRVVVAAVLIPSIVFAQGRPANIVLIVADDMGYGDIGVHGANDISTPNIDALAASGIRFTDGYVTGPYCSPTRAGLLTGKYPQRFGHEFNIGGMMGPHRDAGLPLNQVTLADRLREAGYRTAIIGKWHLGTAHRFRPRMRGFDEFYGFLEGAHEYVAQAEPNRVFDDDSLVVSHTYLTDDFTNHAVSFIERNKLRPFFLYVAYNAVHVPLQATDKYLARFPDLAEPRRTYAAMLSAMDDGVGRTIRALRENGLEDHTLIVFFSDNGGPTQVGGVNGSSNAPLRGSKRQTLEGGIRVPFIVSWKDRLPSGRTDTRPVIQLDVYPTALAAAGVAVRPEWKLDGVNLLPYLSGRAAGVPHETLYWRLGTDMAIRSGDWKLVKTTADGFVSDPAPVNLERAELFNLKDDVGEKTNLAAAHPDRVRTLSEAWLRWAKELSAPAWPAIRPVQQRPPLQR